RHSSDPDGSVTGYAWDFGDGAVGTGATPQHTYGAAGTYNVTLTVTDDLGATNAVTKAVQVAGPGTHHLLAAFTATALGLVTTFDGSDSEVSDGNIVSWEWIFGDRADGAIAVSGPGSVVSHQYLAGGTYSVTLTVADDTGATASVTHTVTVEGPA